MNLSAMLREAIKTKDFTKKIKNVKIKTSRKLKPWTKWKKNTFQTSDKHGPLLTYKGFTRGVWGIGKPVKSQSIAIAIVHIPSEKKIIDIRSMARGKDTIDMVAITHPRFLNAKISEFYDKYSDIFWKRYYETESVALKHDRVGRRGQNY